MSRESDIDAFISTVNMKWRHFSDKSQDNVLIFTPSTG